LIPAAVLVVTGVQPVFSSFYMSASEVKLKSRKPPMPP